MLDYFILSIRVYINTVWDQNDLKISKGWPTPFNKIAERGAEYPKVKLLNWPWPMIEPFICPKKSITVLTLH